MKKLTLIATALLPLFSMAADKTDEVEDISFATNMYSSQRAWRIGDLVTISVNEQSSSNKSEDISTDKSHSMSIAEGSIGGSVNEGSHLLKKVTTINPPVNLSGSSSYSGAGSSANTEALTASYTARVVDVLPNNVLVLRGERIIEKNGERVEMVLTGSIRQRDISASNMINSDKMADARIVYETKGDVTNGTRPGWFWRFCQAINPF